MPDFAVRTAFTATDRISPAFNRMGNSADRFGRRGSMAMGRVGRAASRVGGMIRGLLPLIGVASIFRFGQRATQLFQIQQAAVANVEAGLRSTNNAIGMTSRELQNMAAVYERTGLFGDETVLQEVTAQLLTFGNIGRSVFNRTQAAAQDMAAKINGVNVTAEQLRTLSIMLGRAIDDPVRGLTAMRRVGVTFSDQEAVIIRRMVATNNLADAQGAILGILERQYGGTNEALARTSAGMDRLAENTMGTTMERVGEQIEPLKRAFLDFAVWILPKLNAALPYFVKFLKAIAPVALAAAAAFGIYKIVLMAVWAAQKIIAAASFINYMIGMAPLIMRSVKALGLMQFALKGTALWQAILAVKSGLVTAATWLFNAALWANPITWIIIGIIALVAAVILLIKYWDEITAALFGSIPPMNEIMAGWDVLSSVFIRVGRVIMTALLAPINLLITGIISLLQVASNIPGIGDSFARAAERVRGFQTAANAAVGSTNLLAGATPPNAAEASSRQVNLQGEININNAPPGTTATSSTRGAARIPFNLIGANP